MGCASREKGGAGQGVGSLKFSKTGCGGEHGMKASSKIRRRKAKAFRPPESKEQVGREAGREESSWPCSVGSSRKVCMDMLKMLFDWFWFRLSRTYLPGHFLHFTLCTVHTMKKNPEIFFYRVRSAQGKMQKMTSSGHPTKLASWYQR